MVMTMSEVVAMGRKKDVPLVISGSPAGNIKGFNERLIDKNFLNASAIEYTSKLLGVNTRITLKMTSVEPRKLYEIEARFPSSKKSELLEILTGKYSIPSTPYFKGLKAYQWGFKPDKGSKEDILPIENTLVILLLNDSFYNYLTYTDIKLKEIELKQKSHNNKIEERNYTPEDTKRF